MIIVQLFYMLLMLVSEPPNLGDKDVIETAFIYVISIKNLNT